MYDGDTIFCLATGAVQAPYDAVEAVAADVVSKAIADGVRAAAPRTTPGPLASP
jgi:L-aminopeptidase/D-esterase-like protein